MGNTVVLAGSSGQLPWFGVFSTVLWSDLGYFRAMFHRFFFLIFFGLLQFILECQMNFGVFYFRAVLQGGFRHFTAVFWGSKPGYFGRLWGFFVCLFSGYHSCVLGCSRAVLEGFRASGQWIWTVLLSLGAVLVYFIAVFLGVPDPIWGEFQGSFGGDLVFFFRVTVWGVSKGHFGALWGVVAAFWGISAWCRTAFWGSFEAFWTLQKLFGVLCFYHCLLGQLEMFWSSAVAFWGCFRTVFWCFWNRFLRHSRNHLSLRATFQDIIFWFFKSGVLGCQGSMLGHLRVFWDAVKGQNFKIYKGVLVQHFGVFWSISG